MDYVYMEKRIWFITYESSKITQKKFDIFITSQLWRYRIIPWTTCSRKFDRYIKIDKNYARLPKYQGSP